MVGPNTLSTWSCTRAYQEWLEQQPEELVTNHQHYILGGESGHTPIPVELLVWARWLETNRHDRIVGQDHAGAFLVSTVFIGLDYQSWQRKPHAPLLFETLVFTGLTPVQGERYSTWPGALEGHIKWCAWAHKQLP
jgi:hypothetical protein